MKNILPVLLISLLISLGRPAFSAESGGVILDLRPVRAETEEITMPKFINSVLDLGKYFNETYPGEQIETDFSEDVARIFPHLKGQEVFDREQNIRDAVKVYRFFYNVYQSVKAKLLLPEEPPLIVAEKDYDAPTVESDYIESADLVVVQDFKKVLSYGGNARDFKAYAAKFEQDYAKRKSKSDFEKLGRLFTKLEWKKLPYYGIIYDNPFTGRQGAGDWDERGGVKVRLLTEYSAVDKNNEFLGAVHIKLPPETYILAAGRDKPRFNFYASQNLKTAEVLYPMPVRHLRENGEDLAVYEGNFAFPVRLEVAELGENFLWQSKVDLTLCGPDTKCRKETFEPRMELDGGEGYYSSFNNFINQSRNLIPQETNASFSLEKAVVDEVDNGQQILRLEFETDDVPVGFDVFVESPDGIVFKRPRIAVNDGKVIARFESVSPDAELIGRALSVSARLNRLESLRKTIVAEQASLFDYAPEKLSFTLILFGLLGGFILNFMPCVFPVLSIKILSLSKFGADNDVSIRRNFLLTALGIFLSFALIAVVLSLLKYFGHTIGWGMQFQNPIFLVFIMFVIVVFLAVLADKISLRAPAWLNRLISREADANSMMHFVTGFLVVLMATPCTAPYLGTAVGFALGSAAIADIFAIMAAVALGLSLPYLLIGLIPDSAAIFPKPGPWMGRLNALMGIMLFLTLVWLMSVLYAQTDFWVCLRLGAYLTLFYLLIALRQMFLTHLDYQGFEPRVRRGVADLVNWTAAALFAALFAVAVWDISGSFGHIQEERIEKREKIIDYDYISRQVKAGKIVVVSVGADWCLTCRYNDLTVFSNVAVQNLLNKTGAELISVDWTSYNGEVLDFMKKYGRFGLPFYVVFSPMIPDGMVLPEVLTERAFNKLISNLGG